MKKAPKIKTFGFLNVDKPSGLTSSTVVNKVKWLSGTPSGHMGTLDPLASGVLPVGVGNATRLFDYFLNIDLSFYFMLLEGKSWNLSLQAVSLE